MDASKTPRLWSRPEGPGPEVGTAGQRLRLRQSAVRPAFSPPTWGGRPLSGTRPPPSRSAPSEPQTPSNPIPTRPPNPTRGPPAAARLGSRALFLKRLPDASAPSQLPLQSAEQPLPLSPGVHPPPRTPPGLPVSPGVESSLQQGSWAGPDPGPISPRGPCARLFFPVTAPNQDAQFPKRAVTSGVLSVFSPLLWPLSPGHFVCTLQTAPSSMQLSHPDRLGEALSQSSAFRSS